jgi:hypothetical protein
MRAVRGTKSIIYINVAVFGEFFRKPDIAFFFLLIEAKIFKKQNLAWF